MKQTKRHLLERKRDKGTVRNCIDRATDETDVITDERHLLERKRDRNSEELHIYR
jgi:hypothetical protein